MKIEIELFEEREILNIFEDLEQYYKKSLLSTKSNSFRVKNSGYELGHNDSIGFMWYKPSDGKSFYWCENISREKFKELLNLFIQKEFSSFLNYNWDGEEDSLPFFKKS